MKQQIASYSFLVSTGYGMQILTKGLAVFPVQVIFFISNNMCASRAQYSNMTGVNLSSRKVPKPKSILCTVSATQAAGAFLIPFVSKKGTPSAIT